MRVLLVNHEYPPYGGGSGVAMKHLAEALSRHGHHVHVLTGGPETSRTTEGAVTVSRFYLPMKAGRLANLKTWLHYLRFGGMWLKQVARDFGPNIINSHFAFPSGYVASRTLPGVPHVISVVGADIHDPTRRLSADNNVIVRRFTSIAFRSAALVTTPSRDLTARTCRMFPNVPVVTVPWGIPASAIGVSAELPEEQSSSEIVIATLGRLVKRKRIDLLLQAASKIKDHPLRIVVMGDGPQAGRLRQLAERTGLGSSVTFTGRISDSERSTCLGKADVFCLPSEHEGFGLVFLEAMQKEVAVISSNVGGQQDIIRHSVDGFLIPVGDCDALEAALRRLCDDRHLLKRMQKSARERADMFNTDRLADNFVHLYEGVLSGERKSFRVPPIVSSDEVMSVRKPGPSGSVHLH